MRRIAYLHGFNSGPASVKGQALARAIAALPASVRTEYFLPSLSPRPAEAMGMMKRWAESGDGEELTFIGSSLGGYFATHLAEGHAAKAVLINPAIRPESVLSRFLGMQRNPSSGEEYEITADYFAELSAFRIERITRPGRYLLLVQAGDEVLDWRQAIEFYAGAWQFVQGGGDHAYRGFVEQIPLVLRFAGIGGSPFG